MRLLKTFGIVGVLSLVGTSSQPVQAQANPIQRAQGTNASVNANSGFYVGIHQTPWFGNPTVRQQLQLNDEQFNQLNKGYTQSWNRYNQGLTGLDKSLADDLRMQRQLELSGSFNQDFSKSVDGVFSDKAARRRYNQMDWQYRGYGAFNDPTVQQQLKLNDEQRQTFNKYQNEWNQQMNTWQRDLANDRNGVASRWRDARNEWRNRINSTLTPEQSTMWTDMIGKPYDFPADVYFQNGTTTTTSLKPVVK
ncbi:MAG: hypothetical protein ABL921_31570 [Pirellula sp.]